MLVSCSTCAGFVPADAGRCPHCDAAVPAHAAGSMLGKLASAAAAGVVMMTLMACYGASYSDDGWVGCTSDQECPAGSTCDVNSGQCVGVEICGNGFDDDADGLLDGGDVEDCPPLVFETDCENGFDDDDDGDVDCADLDCTGVTACYEDCTDDIDNDLDGLVDCLDSECGVCPLTETHCDDGFDDDEDSLVDCDDDDCELDCLPPVCGDSEIDAPETCDDGNVDPGDGCSATCTHEIEFYCAAAIPLIEGVVSGSSVGGFDLFAASCVATGGPEVRYSFNAAVAGTLYLTLDPEVDLGLYVLPECPLTTVELGCSNVPLVGLDTVALDLVAGQTVFVMVDGIDPAGGAFGLVISFSPD